MVRLLEGSPTTGPIPARAAAAAAARNGSAPAAEDVRDPLGDPIDGYREIADELQDLSDRLAVASRGISTDARAPGLRPRGLPAEGGPEALPRRAGPRGPGPRHRLDRARRLPGVLRRARAVASGGADRAIVLGGSGQGEQIAANKVHGIRAALCHDLYLARLSREHNDANVLALGARVVAPAYAREIVRVWLGTAFEGGRHAPRLEQITDIEREES